VLWTKRKTGDIMNGQSDSAMFPRRWRGLAGSVRDKSGLARHGFLCGNIFRPGGSDDRREDSFKAALVGDGRAFDARLEPVRSFRYFWPVKTVGFFPPPCIKIAIDKIVFYGFSILGSIASFREINVSVPRKRHPGL
jgi:hypothetical protein